MMFSSNDLKEDIKIAKYFLNKINKISKTYIPLTIILAISQALFPLIAIVTPKFIIDELINDKRIETLILIVLIAIITAAALNMMIKIIDTKLQIKNIDIKNNFELQISEHISTLNFEDIEDPKILELKDKALFTVKTQDSINILINSCMSLCRYFFSILFIVAIISTLNIGIVVIILIVILINSKIFSKIQKIQFEFYQELIPLNRKFIYYNSLVTDFMIAKDIRIYNMQQKILSEIENYNEVSIEKMSKIFKLTGKYQGAISVNTQIQNAIIYSYMIYKVITGKILVGSFVMYVSAANSLSDNITKLFNNLMLIRQMCKYLKDYKEFESIKKIQNSTGLNLSELDDFTIEFKNVSFKYPRSENYVLNKISFKINKGDKIAIVGKNGSGKTTFIKLLCRLYEPLEGEILLNGINIKNYKYDEYTKFLGVVFQDYKLFATTIKQNIVGTQIEDEKKVLKTLEKIGLYKKISSMKKTINTQVYKIFDKNGVILSGGQSQKLAITRAIYKEAKFIIMDEPTAALDPYAEHEIYSKLNELIDERTVIFISHRLSSCCFCNKILVFNQGEIKECGNHDELLSADGIYKEMWKAQAKYYNEV